ncbi:DUF2335 domain-containing protein [Bradyrhizobium sp. UFLA05-153]
MSESSSESLPTRTAQVSDPPEARSADGALKDIDQFLERQGVPSSKRSYVIERVTTEMRAHRGPLPAVEDFKGYNEVCPGAAREILDMAVRQQGHAHWMDRYSARSEFWLPIAGIVATVVVVAGTLCIGTYLAMNNHENLAIGVFSGTGVVAIAGAFLQRKKTEEAEQQPEPEPEPPSRKMTRRERRERASELRRR